jgi:hypothetical protein
VDDWCRWTQNDGNIYTQNLVGGLEHEFYIVLYDCDIWDVIPTPLTTSYFSRWLFHHQPEIINHIPVVPHKAVAEVSKIGNL